MDTKTTNTDITPQDESTSASFDDENLSFAELFEQQEKESAKQPRLEAGQKIETTVIAITADTVFVDTGSKVDGIVERSELEKDGELPFAVGDAIELFVVSITAHEIRLSTALRGQGNISLLEDAKNAGIPVEGKVVAVIKGGYHVEIMKRRAFCPLSQIDIRPVQEPETFVGQTLPFAITKLEQHGRNIVVSRRVLLEVEQAEQLAEILKTLEVGSVVETTVTRLTSFGAFAEIAPGIEGLIHISELSWGRVSQPDEVLSIGDVIRVKILSIETTDRGTRFSLSIKEITEDPWTNISEKVNEGDTFTGKVIRNAPFGSFVEILPGIEGLVHISEFSYEQRIHKPEEMVNPGDTVSVKVLTITPDQKKLSLSMRAVAGDPWLTIGETFSVGATVMGTMEKRAAFGLFITLAPGITGLLPASVVQQSAAKNDIAKLGAGDAIEVVIQNIDAAQRKISLAPVGEKGEEPIDWSPHAKTEHKQPSLGMLGQALQQAIEDKKN